jgi:DHA1 family tetracycline resistance protein-like MFS transporter
MQADSNTAPYPVNASMLLARMKKRPLFTIFLVVFFDLLSFGIVIPILPYYSRTFGVSAFALGWLMAAYSLAQFFFAPVWGSLSDRLGRRPVLLTTILLGASSMVATALAGSFWVLLLARLLAGAFAGNISTATAYIADVTSEENRAKGMGVIGAGFGLGFIFGPALGGVLSTTSHGFTLPILVAAGLGFLNFLFAFFVLEEPAKTKVPPTRSRLNGLAKALTNPRTAWPIGLFFLHTLAFTQLEVAFGFYVLFKFGYEAHGAGWFLAGMGFVSALLQGGLIGRLSKKYGEARLLPFGFLVMAVSMAAAPFAPDAFVFSICLLGIATGMGISAPCLSSLTSKGAPASTRGAVMGVYQSGSSLARVLGPPAAGLLYDKVAPGSPLLVSGAIVFAGFLLTLAAKSKLA